MARTEIRVVVVTQVTLELNIGPSKYSILANYSNMPMQYAERFKGGKMIKSC